MPIGVRTQDLRKTYYSPAPAAAQGAGFGLVALRGPKAKRNPEIVALDGISLEVQPGEIFGLLGPNGAGKSTTVGILTTRVRPSGGEAWVGGHEVSKDEVAVKRVIGVVPQRPNLDFALTAREILTFHGAYFGQPARDAHRRADGMLERFKLTERAHQLARGF